jgi:hypothetical protein
VWDISEGDIKFLCAMKLLPPKDLGSNVYPSTIHPKKIKNKIKIIATPFIESTGTWHYSLEVPIRVPFTNKHVFPYNLFFITPQTL